MVDLNPIDHLMVDLNPRDCFETHYLLRDCLEAEVDFHPTDYFVADSLPNYCSDYLLPNCFVDSLLPTDYYSETYFNFCQQIIHYILLQEALSRSSTFMPQYNST